MDNISFHREHLLHFEASRRAAKLEHYAMEWLFDGNDFSDDDMDKFLDALPGYVSSEHTKKDQLDEYLTEDYILGRIREHLSTCVTSLELSEDARISRVSCCVKSLRLIFQLSDKLNPSPSKATAVNKMLRLQNHIKNIIDGFQTLCGATDPIVALRASCIRALAVQSLLTQLAESGEKGQTLLRESAESGEKKLTQPAVAGGERTPTRPFPTHLTPIYDFCCSTKGQPSQDQLSHSADSHNKTKWKALLYDGPLDNLSNLAEVIRSTEHVQSSGLSFCWKTLDILVKELGIGLRDVSVNARNRFDSVRKDTREHIRRTEWGFRIAPLLDILDVISRAHRLSLVFSKNPEYHTQADIVFGKGHLHNRDLLEVFARCLPHYIAGISREEGREFMEGMVNGDHLWTSLQINLWKAQKPDSSTPDKLRVFEDCCMVLDAAFSCLEGSTEVDWRAPEFGSLVLDFESFVSLFQRLIYAQGY
jgi:hypothetical protein